MRPAAAAPLLGILLAACTPPPGLPVPERGPALCRAVLATPSPPPGVAVRWTLPADSAQRALLDAYCAGVGPAVLHEAGPAAPPPDDGLAVVAWNMALGAGDVLRLIADLRAGLHTDGSPVHSFVLLLQEVPRIGPPVPPRARLPDGVVASSPDPVHGPSVMDLAVSAGLHLLYVPSMREGLGDTAVDHGTALLSTLPLSGPQVFELPPGIRRRVAAAATVRLHGAHEVLVVSAHLDNFSLRQPVGSFGAVRARQARALARALPASGAVVLGADLNTWARGTREPAFRVLRARLPRPAELQPEPTARRLGVPRRLDYLLLDAPPSWSFAEHRIRDRYGSDHHPLIGVLRPAAQPQPR
jgi:endonuclease/exonuclease/phosphatase family metal-dependent hydrolase